MIWPRIGGGRHGLLAVPPVRARICGRSTVDPCHGCSVNLAAETVSPHSACCAMALPLRFHHSPPASPILQETGFQAEHSDQSWRRHALRPRNPMTPTAHAFVLSGKRTLQRAQPLAVPSPMLVDACPSCLDGVWCFWLSYSTSGKCPHAASSPLPAWGHTNGATLRNSVPYHGDSSLLPHRAGDPLTR